MDTDLLRAWQLITELSEQNSHNKQIADALKAQAATLQEEARQNASTFSLKRYTTDIGKEAFESELERTNAQTIIENQTLQHENKQLNVLLKEYEQTMETVMTKFRAHAVAAQQHEMKLGLHYEALLASREGGIPFTEFAPNTGGGAALQRLALHLQYLLRATKTQEDDEDVPPSSEQQQPEAGPSHSQDDDAPLLTAFPASDSTHAHLFGDSANIDGQLAGMSDWAHSRELEIARLEAENAALRRTLGIDTASAKANGWLEAERAESARLSALLLSASRTASAGGSRDLFGAGGGGGNGSALGGGPRSVGPGGGWGSVRAPASGSGIIVSSVPPGGGGPGMGPSSFMQSPSPMASPMASLMQAPMQPPAQPPPFAGLDLAPPGGPPGKGGLAALQRASELGPGMRGGTRRPAMFGNRGGAPGRGAGYWAPPPDSQPWAGLSTGGMEIRR